MQGNMNDRSRHQPCTTEGHAPVRRDPNGCRRVDSADLLGTEREILILHAGQAYHLRATASGKLILTK